MSHYYVASLAFERSFRGCGVKLRMHALTTTIIDCYILTMQKKCAFINVAKPPSPRTDICLQMIIKTGCDPL